MFNLKFFNDVVFSYYVIYCSCIAFCYRFSFEYQRFYCGNVMHETRHKHPKDGGIASNVSASSQRLVSGYPCGFKKQMEFGRLKSKYPCYGLYPQLDFLIENEDEAVDFQREEKI